MVVHEIKIFILKSRDIIPKSSDEDRSTVKTPYNDTTYLTDHIVIPKVSLYPIFIYKIHLKSKLDNNPI